LSNFGPDAGIEEESSLILLIFANFAGFRGNRRSFCVYFSRAVGFSENRGNIFFYWLLAACRRTAGDRTAIRRRSSGNPAAIRRRADGRRAIGQRSDGIKRRSSGDSAAIGPCHDLRGRNGELNSVAACLFGVMDSFFGILRDSIDTAAIRRNDYYRCKLKHHAGRIGEWRWRSTTGWFPTSAI
jgi:hypothetical protein